MPEWAVILVALAPVLALVGGGLGALITFRIQGRQAGAATLTAEAAHETATVAGRKAAVEEMAELRQHWSSVVANVMADNATVRADNATLKADLSTLRVAHTGDMVDVQAKITVGIAKQALTDLKLLECEALNRAMAERVKELGADQQTQMTRLDSLEQDVQAYGQQGVGEQTGGEESARRG